MKKRFLLTAVTLILISAGTEALSQKFEKSKITPVELKEWDNTPANENFLSKISTTDKVKAKDHQFGFDELFRIDDFFANDDGVTLAVLDDGDCYPISFLEHATDEEIKAGKRLEVAI